MTMLIYQIIQKSALYLKYSVYPHDNAGDNRGPHVKMTEPCEKDVHLIVLNTKKK